MASLFAIGAVLWWNRCRSNDDSIAGIILSFSAQSEQVHSLNHLSPNAAKAEPSLNCIGLAGVGAPVVFINATLDMTYHPFSDDAITGCFQNDLPAIQLKRVSHF